MGQIEPCTEHSGECQAGQAALRRGDSPLEEAGAASLTFLAQLTSWSTLETTNSAVAGFAKAVAALEAISP